MHTIIYKCWHYFKRNLSVNLIHTYTKHPKPSGRGKKILFSPLQDFLTNKKLSYRGRMDKTSPNSDQTPNGNDLREAINNILNNINVPKVQYPSMGCNIKWKV